MKRRIILNDQGLYVDCIVSNDRISFEFEKGLENLNDKVRLYKDGQTIYGILGLKRFVRISDGMINKVMSITSTEIRILCAFANRVDYLIKKNKESKATILSEFYSIVKKIYSLPMEWNKRQIHHTELHTHFTEILNPTEFISFLNKYNITYPFNESGKLDFDKGEGIPYSSVVEMGYEEELINSLRLKVNEQSSFDDLVNVVNNNRKALLDRIINKNSEEILKDKDGDEYKKICDEISQIQRQMNEVKNSSLTKKEKGKLRDTLNSKLSPLNSKKKHIITNYLYEDLLNFSLDKLTKEKVEYSEISFSNENRLLYLSEEHKHDDRFNLLYSIDRTNSVDSFKKSSRLLEELLNTTKVIGVDIMGNEKPLKGNERDEFKKKIMWLMPVLHIHPNSVLRIHASEFVNANENMLETLKIIDEVAKELNDACSDLFGREWGVVPPPRIRIGHGVNIKEDKELLRLIKKYDVVVEINASSNYALGNIKSLDEIPLKYYEENGISYTISTDGGGVYSTSIHQEENLLKNKEGEGSLLKDSDIPINKDGSGNVKEDDKKIYENIKIKQESWDTKEHYDSFLDALMEEQKRVSVISEKGQVNDELQNLYRYIMDNDVELDNEYFKNMIGIIKKLNEIDKSDYSRMFLYLFEREVFPQRETPFKTLYYIDCLQNNKDKVSFLEDNLRRLFEVVKNEYIIKSENLKNKGFWENTRRR